MPMPSIGDLQTAFGAWNPQAYWTAQDNIGLEQRFRNEELAGQKELTRQRSLANMYEEQSMPGKLTRQTLENEGLALGNVGKGHENRKSKVAADLEENTYQFKLNEAQRKEALALPAHELAMAQLEAQKLRTSMDPAERARGEALWMFSDHVRELQLKHKQDMEKVDKQGKNSEKIANIGANATIEAAKIGATSRENVAGIRGAGTLKPPTTPEAARIRQLQGMLAEGQITPEQYEGAIVEMINASQAAKAAAAQAGVAPRVGPDGRIIIENKPVVPGVSPVNAPKAPGPQNSSPPKSAVDFLQKNPHLKAAFDAKYGAGAADKALGK